MAGGSYSVVISDHPGAEDVLKAVTRDLGRIIYTRWCVISHFAKKLEENSDIALELEN